MHLQTENTNQPGHLESSLSSSSLYGLREDTNNSDQYVYFSVGECINLFIWP